MSDSDIFNIDDDESYYSEAAMKYLAEANEARDELNHCSQELKREEVLGKTFRRLNKMQFDDIVELKNQVREKNFEIEQLKKQIEILMGDSNKLYPHGHVSVSHIKTDEIIKRIHDIHRGIQHDQMLFQRTGIYQNFDGRIGEVRDLFNLMLMQLNVLNSNHREVTRTLVALEKLDAAESLLRSMQQKNFPAINGNPSIHVDQFNS